MPAAITDFVGRLQAMGMSSCTDLAAVLYTSKGEKEGLNFQLQRCGYATFTEEEIHIMNYLLHSAGWQAGAV
jgi:hypothetical protein